MAELNLEEEWRLKQRRITLLQQQINEKRAKLSAVDDIPEQAGPSNIKELRSTFPSDALSTRLDGILHPANTASGSLDEQLFSLHNPLRSHLVDLA